MGQCYTVEAKLGFASAEKEQEFCSIINSMIEEMDGKSANFGDISTIDRSTPFGCFLAVTTNYPHQFGQTDGVWYADFHGSYGWEGVMETIFSKAIKACAKGSKFTVYPDNGHWTIRR